jgi:hypothetical protein
MVATEAGLVAGAPHTIRTYGEQLTIRERRPWRTTCGDTQELFFTVEGLYTETYSVM